MSVATSTARGKRAWARLWPNLASNLSLLSIPEIKSPLQYIVSLENDCWTGRSLGKITLSITWKRNVKQSQSQLNLSINWKWLWQAGAVTSHQHSYWEQVDESGSRHPWPHCNLSQEIVLNDQEYSNLQQMNAVIWVSWITELRIRFCLEVSVLSPFPWRELRRVPYVSHPTQREVEKSMTCAVHRLTNTFLCLF